MDAASRLLAHEPWVRTYAGIWANHVGHDLSTVAGLLEGDCEASRLAHNLDRWPRVHLIRYEDVHADPTGERDAMFRFLEVDPTEAAAPSAETKTTAGFGKENPTSFYRKGAVGDWRNHLAGPSERWFAESAAPVMKALGYLCEGGVSMTGQSAVPSLEHLKRALVDRNAAANSATGSIKSRVRIEHGVREDPARVLPRTPDGRAYRPFFICGHMRSGTTWVRNLLNLHPDVNCQSEGPLGEMVRAMDKATGWSWLTSSRDDMPEVLRGCMANLARDYTLALARYKPEAAWIGDHTSRTLRPLLPGAPHIYILRDGRDVITSWTFHQLRIKFLMGEPHASQMKQLTEAFHADPEVFSKHPERLFSIEPWVRHAARSWAADIESDLNVAEAIERDGGGWGATLMHLRYETLIAETEAQRQAMYRFLELDPSRAAPLSEESVTKPSFWKENPMWFYRAGRIGDWKNYATDDFKRWFKEEAGQTLIRAGYAQGTEW